MEFTDEDLNKVKRKLNEYRETVFENEGTLSRQQDHLELENEDGDKLWLHPNEDGETVDIHIMCACVKHPDKEYDETKDLSKVRTKIGGYLVALGFRPDATYTPFWGQKRVTYRADFSQMVEGRNDLERQIN